MKPILNLATLVVAAVFPIYAWQAAPQQPKPKSQKEVDALKKVQADAQAGNTDQEITDINYVLETFADTEYKDNTYTNGLTASICAKIKAEGTIVYTVLFDVTDPQIESLLHDCASDPGKSYVASDAAGLQTAFKNIGTSLTQLRLTK